MQLESLKLSAKNAQFTAYHEIRLTWRFVVAWVLGVVGVGYCCFSLLLFGMSPEDGPRIGLADCFFYPLRRAEIRQKQGAYLIEKAQIEARQGRRNSALTFFGSGLAKNPFDWATRLHFARLLHSVDARDSMRRLLEEGLLVSSQEPRYIDGVLIIAAATHETSLLLKACDAGLIAARKDPDRRERALVLLEHKAAALLSAGRTEEALEILPKLTGGEKEGRITLRAHALLRLDLSARATQDLVDWLSAHEGNASVSGLLARAFRESNDLSAMEAVLARSLVANPEDPAVFIDLIYNRVQAGNTHGARDALNKFFVKFYGNPDNLIPLARAISKTEDTDMLALLIAEADAVGYAGIGLREIMVEFLAGRGEWAQADVLLGEIARRRNVYAAPAGHWQLFYTSLVAAASQPDMVNQVRFLELMRAERPHPEAFERVIRQLAQARRKSTAVAIASLAQNRYPELRDWSSFVRECGDATL